MKSFIILFSLLAIITLVSCDKDKAYPAKRRLVNLTSYPLEIKVWSRIEDVYEYSINSFDTLDIIGTCSGPPLKFCILGWSGTLDSATIIFNNEKILKFGNPSDLRLKAINADPVGGDRFGYRWSEEDEIVIHTYEITQEDYDNAEDIGG